MVDLKPTLILIDTPCHDRLLSRSRSREPSPHSAREMDEDEEPSEELYGLALLQRIVSESYLRNLSKLVIPVPLIRFSNSDAADGNDGAGDAMDVSMADGFLGAPNERQSRRSNNWRLVRKCLDSGATDVVANPISAKCATNLEVHAYRAHREATREQKALLEIKRGRKRSWVGISEEKPFSYLRETMVSCLLTGICRGDLAVDEAVNRIKVSVPAEKQAKIAEAIGHWSFCAHDFSDDELIIAASAMFKHALSMPELEPWRIPTGASARRSMCRRCFPLTNVASSRPAAQLCHCMPGCV